jgi:hypothetical protein
MGSIFYGGKHFVFLFCFVLFFCDGRTMDEARQSGRNGFSMLQDSTTGGVPSSQRLQPENDTPLD